MLNEFAFIVLGPTVTNHIHWKRKMFSFILNALSFQMNRQLSTHTHTHSVCYSTFDGFHQTARIFSHFEYSGFPLRIFLFFSCLILILCFMLIHLFRKLKITIRCSKKSEHLENH